METPWGPLEVCDAHVHFFSHRFYSLLAAQKGPGGTAESACAALGWPAPPERPEDLAAEWAAELDRHGVSRAALIASLPGDEGSVARAVAAFPHRFTGYFLINPLAAGAEETCRAALESGLRGIVLFPAMHGYSVNDEHVRPLIEMAEAMPGCIVFVHCGVLSVGVRAKLGLPSRFDLRYSNPVEVHPVALRYPRANFVIPHFAAGYFREALMVCDLCPNVYLDTSSSNAWTKYQPQEMSLADVFRRALAVTGPERLLFGTDSSFFPRGWQRPVFEQQVAAARSIGMDAEQAGMVLGGNLKRLLHL